MSEAQTPDAPAVEQTPSQPVGEPALTPSAAKSYFSDESGWNREAFAEDLGSHSIFEKYKTPEELVKATINKDQLIGKKAEEFWTSEDADIVARRREVMGVPSDPTEYQFELPELGEGIPADELAARYEQAKPKFQELGLTKAQAQALIEWDAQQTVESFAQAQEANRLAMEEAEKTLRNEWKGDKYEYNLGKAKNTLEHLGLSDWIEDPTIANNPSRIKDIVEKLVPLVSDDAIIEARQTQTYATIKDLYDDQYNKMMGMDPRDPSYQREIAKMREITDKMAQMS